MLRRIGDEHFGRVVMAKKGSAKAQRAKKKNEKANRRKKAVAQKKSLRLARGAALEASSLKRYSRGYDDSRGPLGLGDIARLGLDALTKAPTHPFAVAYHIGISDGAPRAVPPWTPQRVALLDETTLLEKLHQIGVAVDREAFARTTGDYLSAWKLATDLWLPLLAEGSSAADRDFVRLAAVELWKRVRPELPPAEQLWELGDAVGAACEADSAAAVEAGRTIWEHLKRRFGEGIAEADVAAAFLDHEPWAWLDDMAFAAKLVAGSDISAGEVAAKAVRTVLDALPQIDLETRADVVRNLAEAYQLTGHEGEALGVVEALVARWPDEVVCYSTLSEYHESNGNLRQALAALEQVEARALPNGDFYEVELRISELREQLEDEAD